MRIAVLGGGVMGETLAGGFLSLQPDTPSVVVAEKRVERAVELAALLGIETADPVVAVAGADVVVLVVKPQDMATLLDEVGSSIASEALVISIAAGIGTAWIADRVTAGVSIVRAMPNTPARVGLGVTGVSGGAGCSAEALTIAVRLLEAVGLVVQVPESLQDAVTAVSGSGPAYVFLLAEAMTAAAVEAGLDPETAERMVVGTVVGAAELLRTSGLPAAELRRMVTSPNGTTAAAVAELESRDLPGTVAAAVAAARDRSRELAAG